MAPRTKSCMGRKWMPRKSLAAVQARHQTRLGNYSRFSRKNRPRTSQRESDSFGALRQWDLKYKSHLPDFPLLSSSHETGIAVLSARNVMPRSGVCDTMHETLGPIPCYRGASAALLLVAAAVSAILVPASKIPAYNAPPTIPPIIGATQNS